MSYREDPIESYYRSCVWSFHRAAQKFGVSQDYPVKVPELLKLGQKAVGEYYASLLLSDGEKGLSSQHTFSLIILSLQLGMVFAEKWSCDRPGFSSQYVDAILRDGPTKECEALLKEIGLPNKDKEIELYRMLYNEWFKEYSDQYSHFLPEYKYMIREYELPGMLAIYQLGITLILMRRWGWVYIN